uniref:RING-type domain-containing protein n=1 Tax=Alexandrium monilatum TaxID=311494 RepID=A0A7S4QYS0_9DINO|mmetsp:Transcript_21410/g.64260  ORF Transcript_21410/g.64260 Transcript_21410/m.64260 type:complete len:679 (-) Transcript_21410:226-2262(-)|eukprot:CAMPEP_0175207576 /NCGR_PEP_ID=MMETSP0093-20121207/13183_1 /TAXON_ID=311494 /ORGANISM="Alexandrium monilatum, Strain CCMP3105" /LENGTH=678 /DNA_ID=CAMNT_0016500743 /DNA_START=81 /DNA_END=2117 /DNA_ORIENTATION=-
MAGQANTLYKLNYSRRNITDDRMQSLRRELPLGKAHYPYEEVDFSQNELSAGGLNLVLEVCKRCPKLRVLKLYKNQIDDGGAEGLAELCRQCPAIEEMHLSHNRLTAVGVEILITAAEQARPNHVSPLWLRLEQNEVADPDAVFRDLASRLNVCHRDEVRCTVRSCCKKSKVHLPYFNVNPRNRLRADAMPSPPLPGGAPSYRVQRDEAGSPVYNASQTVTPKHLGPGTRVPGPMNPPSRSVVNTPKTGMATPNGSSAWDVSGANAARRFNAQSGAAFGAGAATLPAASGANTQEATGGSAGPTSTAPPGTAAGTGATPGSTGWPPDQSPGNVDTSGTRQQWKAAEEQLQPSQVSKRPSLVLDKQGRRRIVPKQLEAEGSSSQFVCPLCTFVIIRPVITSCSHLFCDTCFRNWVGDQVSKQKKGGPGDAPVPLIQCPQPKCTSKLRKRDIIAMDQADATKVGAVQLLQRMRNNLQIRCVHHAEHFKYPFGADASHVKGETGLTCTWVGDLPAYEEHVRKGCPVERYLGGAPAGCGTGTGENGRSLDASPLPGGSPPATEQGSGKATSAVKPSATAARSGNTAGGSGNEAAVAQKPEAAVEEPAGDTRVACYDYAPQDTDKAQIPLKKNDLVKVFEVTESGWAAGVRLCRKTGRELGVAGWFPATYLYPADHTDTAATA